MTKRNISSFNDVSGKNPNAKVNNHNNVNNNENDNKDIDQFFDKYDGHSPTKQKKTRAFYLEPEVMDQLDRMKKRYGKGALSEFVNAAIKDAMKRKGLL